MRVYILTDTEIIFTQLVRRWSDRTILYFIYFRAQTSDGKPQILRESSSRQTKSDTKSAGELSDQVKTTIKETSEKLQVLFYSSSPPKYFCANWRILIRVSFDRAYCRFLGGRRNIPWQRWSLCIKASRQDEC